MKIEYAHTMHSPNKITEHRRLNLGLFCIKLKDITYTRKTLDYIGFFGLRVKSSEPVPYWDSGKNTYWLSDPISKRLNAVRSNPPYLKLVG